MVLLEIVLDESADIAPQGTTADVWISIVLTALSLVFAVWSWWASSVSKKARIAAEKAEENAERRVQAAEAAASELRKLVASLQLPPLVATSTATGSQGMTNIMLRNTTGKAIELISVVNQPSFARLVIDPALPSIVNPGAQFELMAIEAFGYRNPSNLDLAIRDAHGERLLHVAIPYPN